MDGMPVFPDFRELCLDDRQRFGEVLSAYRPVTSEWTFTNLFVWRKPYGLRWCMYRDWLLVVRRTAEDVWEGYQPVGPSPRREPVLILLEWLRDVRGMSRPTIVRADRRCASEVSGLPELSVRPVRDDFDYVYRSEDLIELPGRAYHAKRTNIRKFGEMFPFACSEITDQDIAACLDVADRWCRWRPCEEDVALAGELEAIRELLGNYRALGVRGGLIRVSGTVAAFSIGEMLNQDTAVIHIEKADPELSGAYAVINREFVRQAWSAVPFINREQDMGEPGLRKAKESYRPYRLEEKFRIVETR